MKHHLAVLACLLHPATQELGAPRNFAQAKGKVPVMDLISTTIRIHQSVIAQDLRDHDQDTIAASVEACMKEFGVAAKVS